MTTIIYIPPDKFTWVLYQMPPPLDFWVYRIVIDNISFYHPFEPVHTCEFEEFFHFGAHCSGYDMDRVVIKDSQKPGYKPVARVTDTKDGL